MEHRMPTPVLNKNELDSLDILKEKYEKMIEPGFVAKTTKKIADAIPSEWKKMAADLGINMNEQEIYKKMMELAGSGFKTLEEQAAKFTISESQIVQKINKNSIYNIGSLDEICFVRSYEIAKTVNSYKNTDLLTAAIEGAGTGAAGFWGLPFNIVLSTFLYFRAVQTIAMHYGYDVKNDSSELVIASEVFASALNPATNEVNNELTSVIGKVMVMTQASVVKQTAGKSWQKMAERGGIPLLLAQMRALANAAAKKALEKAGKKGLENSMFKEVLEQIGKKLTKDAIGKAVPYFSAVFSALVDTAQMKKILDYADIFYQKRFIMEKEARIDSYFIRKEEITDAEIVNEDIINNEEDIIINIAIENNKKEASD